MVSYVGNGGGRRKTKPLSLRLDERLHADLSEAACVRGQSITVFVERALTAAIGSVTEAERALYATIYSANDDSATATSPQDKA